MKFSIIICAYNVKNKIPKTLESILSQSFQDYEVIVVDGKSTDGTIEVIEQYIEKFKGRMKWVNKKDSGIYEAMNNGIRIAKGEYLNIIGAGDWFEEGVFERVDLFINKNKSFKAFYGRTCIWDINFKKNRVTQTLAGDLLDYPMQHPALFYKKELHEKFGLYDESYKIAADYLFCLKAFYKRGVQVGVMDFIISNFVTDGISSINKARCLEENMRAKKEIGFKDGLFKRIIIYLKIIKNKICPK